MSDRTPLLEARGLVKRFGSVVIADGLDLAVTKDEALGIVGPNGAGKSSLFNLLSGDLRPDGGRILLDGADLTRARADTRCRAGIGRTYQIPRPLGGMTVFENVLVAAFQGAGLRGRAAQEAAWAALERCDLADAADEAAGRLGLLARKRLEIARGLGSAPRVLLLDEVAGGLTDPEVDELVAVIAAIREGGVAIVWIEHVVRALRAAVDRLICLAGGEIVAAGTVDEVLADPAVRRIYLGGADEEAA